MFPTRQHNRHNFAIDDLYFFQNLDYQSCIPVQSTEYGTAVTIHEIAINTSQIHFMW